MPYRALVLFSLNLLGLPLSLTQIWGGWRSVLVASMYAPPASKFALPRGNVSAPGIFCDPCPTGGLLPLICWATLYGFAPWPPGHQQMF